MNYTKNNLRPAAAPLVTVDPFFSIWSFDDELNGGYTRHWTGRINPMFAGVTVDSIFYSAMGVASSRHDRSGRKSRRLEQKSLRITPLRTIYTFENSAVRLTLTFLTPLMLDNLDIMARPVSYIDYKIDIIDGREHNIKFIFGISAECCVDTYEQSVRFGTTGKTMFVGNADQKVLAKSGDSVCIEWGYLHVENKSAKAACDIQVDRNEKLLYREIDTEKTYNAYAEKPYILIESGELSDSIALGYDEVKPIEYFGVQLDEYYKKTFRDFDEMFAAAIAEHNEIVKQCEAYDEKLLGDFGKLGEKYAKITSLAYRQAIAAHKLSEDTEGNILFLSKECHSNGCIGTLDVTYPSIPLFLKYNPKLVIGMLNPIIKYAYSDAWCFDFAPHDVGQYPLANGQVYGDNKLEMQMPIEECGNMLICVAACERALGNSEFSEKHRDILKKWADYLVKKGYNPENQLCTDDFAGHLAQNCNLSLKSILGIASCGMIFSDKSYLDKAKEMADKWTKDAAGEFGTKLSFNAENTWSLKYNIVWDKLFGLGLFGEDIYKNEIELYKTKAERYGIPLDSRATYTKLDWLMWTIVMTEDREYIDKVIDMVYNMINETEDRVPMCDWYDAVTGKQCEFQNRTVVGGIYIPLLSL